MLHRRRPAHALFIRKWTSTSQCLVNGTPQRPASSVSFRPNRADSNTTTASGGQPIDRIVLKQATSSTSGGGCGVSGPPTPSKKNTRRAVSSSSTLSVKQSVYLHQTTRIRRHQQLGCWTCEKQVAFDSRPPLCYHSIDCVWFPSVL